MRIQTSLRRFTASLGCAGLLLLPPGLRSESGAPAASPLIGYEIVGQVLNPSAQQSLQYGYLNFVRGLDQIATPGNSISESTALLMFYNDTATQNVINNGTIRVIDRTGTGAIYFDSGNGDFSSPDTFRKGTPIQNYTLRHQVLIDTSTGYFTATFEITITAVTTFQIDGKRYRLGRRGGIYRLSVSGKLTQQAPPSAYIAGAADGPGVEGLDGIGIE